MTRRRPTYRCRGIWGCSRCPTSRPGTGCGSGCARRRRGPREGSPPWSGCRTPSPTGRRPLPAAGRRPRAHLPGAVAGEAPAATDHILRVGGYYLPGGGRRHGAHERVTTPASAAAPPVVPAAVVPAAVVPRTVVAGAVVPRVVVPEVVAPEPPEQVPAAVAAPAPGSLAASGLPVRIPQANRLPGSAGPEPDEAPPPSVAAATRSADAARSRLGGYQRGTRRAEQQMRAGKRADQERADH